METNAAIPVVPARFESALVLLTMEIFQDSADKENLNPDTLLAHGGGKGKGGSGLGGGNGGAGGGGKGSNKGAAVTSTTSGTSGTSSACTKKRKLSAAAAAASQSEGEEAGGLGGKAPAGSSATQPPQRKRPLLRSCSTPPAASASLPANTTTKPQQRANPFLALAAATTTTTAAAMEEQDECEMAGNDENADPQRGQQQARRPETHNSKLFGLLGNRSLPPAANSGSTSSTANNGGGGLLMARLGSLAGICLPTASPKGKTPRMEAEVDMDEEEDDEASPFNEGYGTRAALPRDLSLKSGLCFEAARPFDWCRAVPGHVEAEGMLRHLKEATGVAAEPTTNEKEEDIAAGLKTREDALAAWVAASYYYSNPADRLPTPQHLALQQVRKQTAGAFAARDPAPVAAAAWQPQGGEGGAEAGAALPGVLYRRLREWEEAFRHLYGLYRHDPGMTFYMVAPDFTVAWTREVKKGGEEDSSMGKLAAEVDALLSQGDEEEEAAAAKGGVVPGTEEGLEEEEEDNDEPVKLKAVISTSKRWLRERLRAAGIAFHLPLAPDAAVRDQEDGPAPDVRAELEALRRHDLGVGGHATVELQVAGARRRRAGTGAEIPRHRSHLVVSGALAVHGLFTFLSDLGNSLAPNAVGDVPRLLAARPFAHGVMGRLQVAANTPVQRTLGGLGGDGGMETVYQLKLRGPVMPAQLRRLAGVVHFFNVAECGVGSMGLGQQKVRGAMAVGDWSLTMEVAPGTEAFNNNNNNNNNGGEGVEKGQGEQGAMSMKEVRFHAAKGRFVTIRMTAPSPSSSASARAR